MEGESRDQQFKRNLAALQTLPRIHADVQGGRCARHGVAEAVQRYKGVSVAPWEFLVLLLSAMSTWQVKKKM